MSVYVVPSADGQETTLCAAVALVDVEYVVDVRLNEVAELEVIVVIAVLTLLLDAPVDVDEVMCAVLDVLAGWLEEEEVIVEVDSNGDVPVLLGMLVRVDESPVDVGMSAAIDVLLDMLGSWL